MDPNFYNERSEKIRERLMDAVRDAIAVEFESDEIGMKYETETPTGFRLGFKEGMGFDITIAETYRPAMPGRTGGAAVDRAIADVREKAERELKDIYRTRPIPYPAATFHALRVLADAVEELRGEREGAWDVAQEFGGDLAGIRERAEAAEADLRTATEIATELRARLVAAEAERDEWERVAGESQNRMSEHAFRAERLARQVADLERALRRIAEEPPPQAWADASEIARDALDAAREPELWERIARSRNPQAPSADREEPQT